MAEKKQKTQMYVLIGLAVLAALVWYVQSEKSPTSSGFSQMGGTYTPINAQDFGSVFEKLKSTEGTEYKTSGRNIFAMSAVPVVAGAGNCCTRQTQEPASRPHASAATSSRATVVEVLWLR